MADVPIWGYLVGGAVVLIALGTLATLAARSFLAQVRRGDDWAKATMLEQRARLDAERERDNALARAVGAEAEAARLKAAVKTSVERATTDAVAEKEHALDAIAADPVAAGNELLSKPWP